MQKNKLKSQINDFLYSMLYDLKNLRIDIIFATNELKLKFSRTELGIWWILFQTTIWTLSLYLIFNNFFGNNDPHFLLYLSTGIILFFFLEQFLSESSQLIFINRLILLNLPVSIFSIFIRCFLSNVMTFLINFILIFFLLILFGENLNLFNMFRSIILLILYFFTIFFIGFSVGIISARYRDLVPIISVSLRILFIVTPIFWKKNFLINREYLVEFNPYFHMLEMVRASFLNRSLDMINVYISLSTLLFFFLFSIVIYFNFYKKIKLWI